ncbi:MAG: GDP-mannose 4,6-dehydratase [Corynebacterium sp.]|uniref:NAD-dependent epimerase/dehydratase family protein n=1 Tax=Corynebacterium sp. TaxID=1720 RepID=UPI001DB0DC43|nr:NAD-dependent epimerase/dehydratase family protein [Corynebacterium sp.]MBS5996373.1 GDP-mannose 4,6-dehydratase [Corynebacterium sp.]MDU2587509.1 GDP-mannose 4,6-dehydratase [Corynebacterium sp.]
MRALVTGGAGFIGSHLVDLLVSEGHSVSVLDNFSSGRKVNLASAMKSGLVEVIEGDIKNFDFGAYFQEHPTDVVFHLAAQIDVRHSVLDPVEDAELNIIATIRLADAARRSGVQKIVHTSSGGSIYGSPSSFPVNEANPLAPESPYAASKAAGELYLEMFHRLYGISVSFVAPANVYGPRQNPYGEAGVVAIFSQRLLSGTPTKVFGEGSNTRDYVYVKDVARAFLLAATTPGNYGRFNIGTGVETSDRDLHTAVAKAAGVADNPEFAPARLGDVPRSSLDSSKARKYLGWKPEYDLERGIQGTLDYFRGLTVD